MVAKVFLRLAALLLLFWTACGLGPAMSDDAKSQPPVILCFGDSLTAGYGVAIKENYPSLLQERLQKEGFPHKVVNVGVSGDTSVGGFRRLGWAMWSQPAIAIVELGVNDGMRGSDSQEIKRNLAKIIDYFQQKQVRVILAGMRIFPNYGVQVSQAFARIYPELAESHHIPMIPFFLAGVAGEPRLNLEDGIHPNAEGYRVILENVWSVLKPELTKP